MKELTYLKFGGESISPTDLLPILFLVWAGHVHPVIHSFANFGLSNSSLFLRTMALSTIKYNSRGVVGFPKTVGLLHKLGSYFYYSIVSTHSRNIYIEYIKRCIELMRN